MSKGSAPRCAFTLLEAIVVIAIVGILISLTVPAVQLARESAGRATCSNNLRQIGLAFMQFDNARGALPGAFGPFPCDSSPLDPGTSTGSAFFQILPYIGEAALFSSSYQSDLQRYLYTGVRGKDVKSYICPSDPLHDRPGLGNYVVNESLIRFSEKPGYRLSTIPDGASATILCTESICRALSLGRESLQEWMSASMLYYLRVSLPIQIVSLREWNGQTSSSHHSQPVLHADGAVHRRAFPISERLWEAASKPDDGQTWPVAD